MFLEVQDLVSGYFEDMDILHGVSVRAEKDKITCVLGPNGSGKTTLLKTIYGFLKPKQGTVLYDDEDITNSSPHAMLRRGISYIPQESGLFPHLTVEENLLLGGWTIRRKRETIMQRIQDLYGKFPFLQKRRASKAGFLSGGQQKILEICKGLVVDPTLMLVDEPTAGLAPIASAEVYETLETLAREGRTLLLVDQNVRKATLLSDYVYFLELGRNKLQGPREEFERRLEEMISLWGFHRTT